MSRREKGTPPSSAPGRSGTRRRVAATGVALVVDPDPTFSKVATATLTALGLQVLVVRDSADARAALGRVRVVLALVEAVLPDEDGTALVELMGETHPDLPVVYVSSSAGLLACAGESLSRLPWVSTFLKPGRPGELAALVSSSTRPPDALPARADPSNREKLVRRVGAQYVRSLPRRLRSLEAALERVRLDPTDRVAREAAIDLAHKLRGTAGSYGLPDVTLATATIETELGCPAIRWNRIDAALAEAGAHARLALRALAVPRGDRVRKAGS